MLVAQNEQNLNSLLYLTSVIDVHINIALMLNVQTYFPKDPNNNKIKQWINASSSEYGVVENFMLVDTEPIVGKWKIVVATNRIDGKVGIYTISFVSVQSS